MSLENPFAPDLTPYESVFQVGPLHHAGAPCCHSGCVHCARCGLGPQPYLTYRYESGGDNDGGYRLYRLSNGLCPRCAS